MVEILPCPFCGNGDPYWDEMLIDETRRVYFLACAECEAEGPTGDTMQAAGAAWNGRAPC